MRWVCKFEPRARKELEKLDRSVARRVLDYLEERVLSADDPRTQGKPLTGNRTGFWRYRVGDYRIVCHIRDGEFLVLVVQVAHRREVYR